MADTLLRQWHMLRLIPVAPRKISTAELKEKLAELGFETTQRSIQRDLQHLIGAFPLKPDERSKPYGWSWSSDRAPLSVPNLDLHTAMAFRMARGHLEHLLPGPTQAQLEPWFQQASRTLDGLQDTHVMRRWPDKVAVLPSGPARRPPRVDTRALEAIQEALYRERRLDLVYRRRGERKERAYRTTPLGLVYRDAVGYLVCTLNEHDDIVQLALHRVLRTTLRPEIARPPEGFSLADYVQSQAFGFTLGPTPLALVLRLDPSAAPGVVEAPLAPNQRVTDEPDGWLRVQATVADTQALRTWILGFGPLAEVLAPAALRDDIAARAQALAARYA